MKRNGDWDEEEESYYEDANASKDEESDNEEPRIKDVLEGLQFPTRFPTKGLRSIAQHGGFQRYLVLDTSRAITSKPANNTSDEHFRAVEYVLLPQNDDAVKPRALKPFIDGLEELSV